MNITFNEQTKTFKLDTENTSYCMMLRRGFLQHAYYGAKIGDDDLSYIYDDLINASFTPWSPSAQGIGFSLDMQPLEYSCNGSGDFRISAFSVETAKGNSTTALKYESYKIFKGKKKLPGMPSTYVNDEKDAMTLEIYMRDNVSGAYVTLSYSVISGVDAIMRSVCVKNTSDKPFYIEKAYSTCVDFDSKDYDLIHFYGHWAAERFVERKPIISGIQEIASKRGSSSHNHNPFVAVVSKDATEDFGDAYGFALCYSGNFSAKIEADTIHQMRVIMGINPEDFKWYLSPDEEFFTPEAIMTYSSEGIGGMSRIMHRVIRDHIARGKYQYERRPILINNWEATYFDFTPEKLIKIAETAAPLGVEMLVLDDGWFGKRKDETTSIGDWIVNTEKLPGGLSQITDKLKTLGMKFGIWFEPEIVSFDSDLYRAHPDWILEVEGYDRSVGRFTAVLDFSRKEVVDYVFEKVSTIIRSADISYVKWDFNRNLTEVGSKTLAPERQKEVFHRYVLGMYDLAERLTSEFPNVLFEGCSGGGGRFDCGMFYYFSQAWTSDNTDAFDRCKIQYGTSFCYPTSVMSAHVSASPNHQTGRSMPFKTRGDVATSGIFGYELDLSAITDDEKNMVKDQIARYKDLYDTIVYGDNFRLIDPFTDNRWCAWQYVKPDKSRAVVTYVVTRGTINGRYHLKLKGLDPDALYEDRRDGKKYHGSTLMNVGINVGNQHKDADSDVLVFDKV